MGEKKLDLRPNGTKVSVTPKDRNTTSTRLWEKLQINEWTFSLLLFLLSLSIVLGKLYINYGSTLQLQSNIKYVTRPMSVFPNMSNVFDLSHLPDVSQFNVKRLATMSEKFVNISQYDDVVSVLSSVVKTYGWLAKATLCGLVMMGFTWFIIYNDSSIPGINPPSPFSPKQRFSKESRIQVNYLIGVVNGILVFIYMCL